MVGKTATAEMQHSGFSYYSGVHMGSIRQRRSWSGERGLGRASNAAKRGSNGVEQHASVSCIMALYATAHPLTNEPWLKSHDSTDTPSRQVDMFQNPELRKGVGQENGGSDRTIKG